MVFWALLFLTVIISAIAGIIYLVIKVNKFMFIKKLARNSRGISYAISAAIIFAAMSVLCLFLGMVNTVIVMLHLVVFLLLVQFVCYLIKKFGSKTIGADWQVITAIVITAAYLLFGAAQAYNVKQTDYTFKTDKNVGNLRVALLADSHLGTTFDADGFEKYLKCIQEQNPDTVVVVGDFVDEGTTASDMQKACRALGKLNTKYGVYFVYGNHDKGKYSNGKRDFNGDDLANELIKNGVSVLKDESVLIDNRFYLIGRQDASEETDFGGKRADMATLTQNLDKDKYWIVLDHQPRDYSAQAACGADLVLSGHTHGGQLIPLKQIAELTGVGGNDKIYGTEHNINSDFIVTSGISDWEISFKTGCFSEYVIIDINQNSR